MGTDQGLRSLRSGHRAQASLPRIFHTGATTQMSKRVSDDHPEPPEAKKPRQTDDNNTAQHVYQPCAMIPALSSKVNSLVEVLLPAKYITSDLKNVKLRRLWGTDVYTDDSDLIAALVHTGHVKLKPAAPKLPLLVS